MLGNKKSLYEREVEAREKLAESTLEAAKIQAEGARKAEAARAQGEIALHNAQEKSRLKEEKRQGRIDAFPEIKLEFEIAKNIDNLGERVLRMYKLDRDLFAMYDQSQVNGDNSMESKNEARLRQDIEMEISQTPLPETPEEALAALNAMLNFGHIDSHNKMALVMNGKALKNYFNRLCAHCERNFSDDKRIQNALEDAASLKKSTKTVFFIIIGVVLAIIAIALVVTLL